MLVKINGLKIVASVCRLCELQQKLISYYLIFYIGLVSLRFVHKSTTYLMCKLVKKININLILLLEFTLLFYAAHYYLSNFQHLLSLLILFGYKEFVQMNKFSRARTKMNKTSICNRAFEKALVSQIVDYKSVLIGNIIFVYVQAYVKL